MSAAKEPKLVVGGVPRVDLLPPEVRVRRQDARINRVLLLVLAVAVVLSGLAVLGAKVVADGSASRLTAAQERTAQLLAQQRRYAAVSTAKARLAAATAARTTVAGSVIDWRAYLQSVSGTLPDGVRVIGATVATSGASGTGTDATAVAPAGTVATLTLQVRTTRWGAVQDWLTALPVLRGFLDASPSTVSRDPQTGVTATVVVHVGAAAYGAPVADTAAASPAGSGPTPSPTPAPAAASTTDATPATTPESTATSTPSPSTAAPLAAGRPGGNG